MPEHLASQENYSHPFQKARETPTAPTFAIYIDQSHAVYNNYHNSQNQKTIETINSKNASSTQAHNSSLHGDAKWTFRRTERTPGQAYSTASARSGPSRSPQRRHNSSPPSSPHLAEFPSPGFESLDTDLVGPGNSQPRNREPASDPIGRYHATSRGLSQHASYANGILAGLSIFIWWLLTWFKNPTGTSFNHDSPSDGVY
ncbi:hypothetical protein EST38_g7323 [Candolleomyces aberdarensis]|uniref:Uncharacterized protein n=1 Tax=Candolleomyces aberdarensis TaxID=2316362 RepID=A0A4V1Q3G7_9AGAR|nr:hypothetical protein EST38_g7323 [Candolleomyces aberdarensis]